MIKRLKQLKVNSRVFTIECDSKTSGAHFSYHSREIIISTKDKDCLLELLCHELIEIVAIEMNVRLCRPDCPQDYIFVYDHRQHDAMMSLFASLLEQFL